MSNPQRFHVIGVQKAGTTWLRNQLVRSPQIRVPYMKEVNLYSREQSKTLDLEISRISNGIFRLDNNLEGASLKKSRRIKSLLDEKTRYLSILKQEQDYKHLFGKLPANIRAYGDVSPSMALLDRSKFQEILQEDPNTKFVVCFRDPVDRLMSAFRMSAKARGGLESIENPGKLLQHLIKGPSTGSFCSYDKLVTELENSVPSENILYVFYENIFSDNSEYQAKMIGNFLNVDALKFDPLEVVHSTEKSGELAKTSTDLSKWARKQLSGQYDFMAEKFGNEIPGKWRLTRSVRRTGVV